ncbi:peptidoglycan recognition protein family protein, partial [Bacillus safensis]|uniref:peptidoglycan recognition protein family protein n=2 Tax=Bacillus TaxID=1386 RepID=UPI001780BEAB
MEIRKNLVDASKYGTKCPYAMNPEFITVHNTYNDATANNEVAYMIRNDNQVSFHIAVDDKEAVQGIPLERNAWHCGDGGGNGNRKSIGVEICYSLNGGERYYKAEDNAAIVVAQLMKQYSIPISKVRTHQSWSGKYCPHRMLAEGRW